MHALRVLEERGKVRNMEVPVRTKDGSVQYGLFAMDNIMIGEVPCLLTTMVDITEQKILEKEMEFHEQEVMQFSRSLDMAIRKLNLLSSITRHDINNQLTVLMAYLEMLELKQPDTSFEEYFRKAATAAQRISTMIQFTKTYESIGVMAPVWQEIHTLADIAAKEAPLGKVILKNDLPEGAEVYADPLIVKVFYNLMDNAVRYGGKITTIRLYVDRGMAVFPSSCARMMAMVSPQMKRRGFSNAGLERIPASGSSSPVKFLASPASLSMRRENRKRGHALRSRCRKKHTASQECIRPAAPGMTSRVTFLIPVISCQSLRQTRMIFVQGFDGSGQGWHAGLCDNF